MILIKRRNPYECWLSFMRSDHVSYRVKVFCIPEMMQEILYAINPGMIYSYCMGSYIVMLCMSYEMYATLKCIHFHWNGRMDTGNVSMLDETACWRLHMMSFIEQQSFSICIVRYSFMHQRDIRSQIFHYLKIQICSGMTILKNSIFLSWTSDTSIFEKLNS